MRSKHTSGKMTHNVVSNELQIGEVRIARVLQVNEHLKRGADPEADENARRLTACWNYCSHLSTAELENKESPS